ncbi:MAG: UDP-3-O-(3-hydroxymyristoyl)glucosamine N-acyltransferase [Candidatus Omnitrophica bacterium]|nr:UDP-3-O-(3-hydroxymyristoyl)glucosamine N-acyltransferase [Candidatus Omnitrophota bacterium]
MRKTLKEIAELVNGEVTGDAGLMITGLCGIKEAQAGDLTFLANNKYLPDLKTTRATAVIIGPDVEIPALPCIRVQQASAAFSLILSTIAKQDQTRLTGVHPTAILGPGVKLGKAVAIGAYCVIEAGVVIGDHCVIYSGCFIGQDTVLGKECFLYPNVVIRERITLKDRVMIHPGAVIGADGFGYEMIEGTYQKILQIGTVIIEDDVEIGANVTIDRARFDKTFIGRGTKIDNLVQIAHNVIIEEHCAIAAQVGISGSNHIGKRTRMGGQAGLAGHLTIGEAAVIAAQAGVTKSVPAGTMVSGYPAKPHAEAIKVNACLQRLPIYVEEIRKLREKVAALEKQLIAGSGK